jgi:tetratricopeptide (TPR) repeat protein
LDAYRTLADSPDAATLDILTCGHLHLICGEHLEAGLCFDQSIARLHAAVPPAPTPLECLLAESGEWLRHGHYKKAAAALRRARARLEVLLAAESGLLLATRQPVADSALQTLVHLGDLTLRLLARTQIARHLAGSLRQRQLRCDLAPWATSSESIQSLLDQESDRLALLARQVPGHAQTEYRLGLATRAAGRMDHAAAAFRRVLALHPHHVSSAVRLALANSDAGVLDKAFHVPTATMRLFADFAAAAHADRPFDEVAQRLCAPRTTLEKATARGNLAFALSELALLDESRESWREPVPA